MLASYCETIPLFDEIAIDIANAVQSPIPDNTNLNIVIDAYAIRSDSNDLENAQSSKKLGLSMFHETIGCDLQILFNKEKL